MAVLIDHLEARLGRLVGTWSVREGAPEGAAQVGYFDGGVFEGVQSYSTTTLHRTHLVSPITGEPQHLELLGCNRPVAGDECGPFPGVLEWVAERLATAGKAVLRGDVLSLPMPLRPGGSLTALYAAMPVYFDDGFFSVALENGTHVSVVWLVPLHRAEAEYVEKYGWPAFESELTTQDPDLFDLERPQMSL
ncbi:suppressor of fused domain protein [Streptomyces brevispora]|uniref:Suppressor of fused domain protein n=1 Tax=Streptomyces brevispora TaxID=887462 RepID=A0A561UW73_9ACTN|nr:suppressor of fused domain protein [Streptomyces brevispora]TWG03602.1 suppressor of fused protein SUFU [Streptomyces brevispora]WSC15376.1 suppressor of fused domain protein [Streptomyces brevispora]